MSEARIKINGFYRDGLFFIILIPIINVINYYLTYSPIPFNWHTALTFLIDTAEGYLAWGVGHLIIGELDRRLPYGAAPLKRIGVQLCLTVLCGVGVIILLTELISRLAGRGPAPVGFYKLDVFIFAIWILVINGIYIGMFFYRQWAEASRQRVAPASAPAEAAAVEGLTVKQGNQRLFVQYPSIAGLYVEGDYVALITVDHKKYLLDQSLDKLEGVLPAADFFRLNRQYIITRGLIAGFEKLENGKLNILLNAFGSLPEAVPMGRVKAPAFKEWFGQAAR
jgi:hypothetical protein